MAFADPYLSKSAVAEHLGCSERTLERMVRDQHFPPPLRRSREALWYESAVMRWLENERDRQLAWEPALRGRKGKLKDAVATAPAERAPSMSTGWSPQSTLPAARHASGVVAIFDPNSVPEVTPSLR